MVQAVLSDIDGTLVQSNWLHASAWQDAFSVGGIDLDVEVIRRQIGKGGDELIPVFVPYWRRRILEEPLKAYRKFVFQQDYLEKVEAFPCTRELFHRMKKSGIKIALSSSANKDELETYKAIARVSDLVDISTTADDVDRSKPHPDIFETALRRLGAKPASVLALGDTPWDAEAAGRAGVRTIGVTTGGWSQQELYDAGCIEVYKDVSDLLSNFDHSAFVTLS
ncbi:HAD family hydrolase [Edaphobacter modestus]|uniref:HAD superfamily hydrolase (TIGR01509 family)/HAD superfamily hydrolase (TIGR01549 family) n=1 Tax=Edaphobacter modestus TaxID=388466 RepID=A0A4Q7YXB2_9BACT|nr:HAD family phosphatase [Edaphobacter modestus]RZU42074.1 HAD superfamily hydrolase (TIGR01509 family)/HAD superfamily hydrolase (TIGR01549 family) [Edaphobacter modestus]